MSRYREYERWRSRKKLWTWPLRARDLVGRQVMLRRDIRRRDGEIFSRCSTYRVFWYAMGKIDLKRISDPLGEGIIFNIAPDDIILLDVDKPRGGPCVPPSIVPPYIYWRLRNGERWHCYIATKTQHHRLRRYAALCGAHTRLGIEGQTRGRPTGAGTVCVSCLRKEDEARDKKGLPPANTDLIEKWKGAA